MLELEASILAKMCVTHLINLEGRGGFSPLDPTLCGLCFKLTPTITMIMFTDNILTDSSPLPHQPLSSSVTETALMAL